MSIQGWFPLGLTVLILLQSKGLSRVFSSTTVQKNQFFSTQQSLLPKHGNVSRVIWCLVQQAVIVLIHRFTQPSFMLYSNLKGFPGSSAVNNPPVMQETQFHPWVGKIPWSKAWQPTPVLLPGESHGLRSLAGFSP